MFLVKAPRIPLKTVSFMQGGDKSERKKHQFLCTVKEFGLLQSNSPKTMTHDGEISALGIPYITCIFTLFLLHSNEKFTDTY